MTSSDLRSEIDYIDEAISELLKRRASVSARIQTERVLSGGARVDLGREREVMSNYAAILGPRGSDVANTVLNYCRGDLSAVRDERQGSAVYANGGAR